MAESKNILHHRRFLASSTKLNFSRVPLHKISLFNCTTSLMSFPFESVRQTGLTAVRFTMSSRCCPFDTQRIAVSIVIYESALPDDRKVEAKVLKSCESVIITQASGGLKLVDSLTCLAKYTSALSRDIWQDNALYASFVVGFPAHRLFKFRVS